MTNRYEVELDAKTHRVVVRAVGTYPEPYGQAMCNEIAAAIESALQGDYIGGYERDDDGGWFKPLGSTHIDGGRVPPEGYQNA
jgi:hypothetical protein